MKKYLLVASLLLITAIGFSQLNPGDKAVDFKLKNVDGKMVSLDDYSSEKGVIIIFTCNHCPYSVLYEDRIIELDKKFKKKGFPVVAINPNSPEAHPTDSYDLMIVRAKEKGFTFPYLVDETQDIYKAYGATKTPHVYLLTKDGNDFKVAYIGAIDDNSKKEKEVKEKFVESAIASLLKGEAPEKNLTKAIGCSIK